jgi:hypothetical protein
LYAMRVLKSIGLRVSKPMSLTIDNKGGRMRHSTIKLNFLGELKEDGTIAINWCSTEDMPADLFTKNLGGPQFKKHTTKILW